jgi:hypothetical protein
MVLAVTGLSTNIVLNNEPGAVLIAEKNGIQKIFKKGDAVTILDLNHKKYKGVITAVAGRRVELKLFSHGSLAYVPIDSITAVTKLGRKGRAAAIVFSIFYFSSLVALLIRTDVNDDVMTGWELIGKALAVGSGVFIVFFWLFTWPFQLLRKRSAEKGWKFSERSSR